MNRSTAEALTSFAACQRVRHLVADYGGVSTQLTTAQITKVLLLAKDEDITATALTMRPRPAWLSEIVPDGRGLR